MVLFSLSVIVPSRCSPSSEPSPSHLAKRSRIILRASSGDLMPSFLGAAFTSSSIISLVLVVSLGSVFLYALGTSELMAFVFVLSLSPLTSIPCFSAAVLMRDLIWESLSPEYFLAFFGILIYANAALAWASVSMGYLWFSLSA